MVLVSFLFILAILMIIGFIICLSHGIAHLVNGLKLEKDNPERKKELRIAIAELSVVATIILIIVVLIVLFATGLIVIRLM